MIRKSAIELKSLTSLLNSSNFNINEGQVQLPKFRIKGRLPRRKAGDTLVKLVVGERQQNEGITKFLCKTSTKTLSIP